MAYYGRWWVCSPSVVREGFHPSALSQHLLTLCLDNRILTLLGLSCLFAFLCGCWWDRHWNLRRDLHWHCTMPCQHPTEPTFTCIYVVWVWACSCHRICGVRGWPTRIISLLLPCGLCTFKDYQARLVEATSIMLWAISLALVLLLPWIYQK